MTRVLIGSTVPAFKMNDEGDWWHWLADAEALVAASSEAGITVDWLGVLQEDARGRELFYPLSDRIAELGGTSYWFSLDTGVAAIDGGSRLGAICTGRNLIIDRALRQGHDWIYFADADISTPPDVLIRLLELDYPVCGAQVPTYGLDGPPATAAHYLNFSHSGPMRRAGRKGDVRIHWTTAGSLMVSRDLFRRVPWRYDPDAGETDDPATQSELARLGWPTLVRHDVVCKHHPEAIGPLEGRGHDLAVYR
jgi:hypothetical protein